MVNNFIGNGYIPPEEQLVFINTEQIPGVQSVGISYTNNATNLKHLGMSGVCNYFPNGPYNGNVDISTLLISDDQFLNFTGAAGVNGHILKTRANTTETYNFTSGYLTNYNCRCSIGEIPQINANFIVFGEMGRISNSDSTINTQLTTISGGWSTLALKIADPGSITFSVGDFTTNRVQDFNVNVIVERVPTYIIGSASPKYVDINYPIDVECSFNMENNSYSHKKLRDFPFNDTAHNMIITLKDLDTSTNIIQYGFSGMRLVSENYNLNTDNVPITSLTYRGAINKE